MVKRYPKEFKRECVEYVQKNKDIPMSEAADNLGIPNSTLQRWLKQADIDNGKSKTGELTSAERLEFPRLKRENRKLKMEAEILKNRPNIINDNSSRRTSGRSVSLYPGEVCCVSCSNIMFGHECVSFGVL